MPCRLEVAGAVTVAADFVNEALEKSPFIWAVVNSLGKSELAWGATTTQERLKKLRDKLRDCHKHIRHELASGPEWPGD